MIPTSSFHVADGEGEAVEGAGGFAVGEELVDVGQVLVVAGLIEGILGAVGNRRKERSDWVRKSLEEYKAQLRERENRTAALYDALINFTRTLDTARPLVQDYTRDYGVSRREIGKQFGLTQRQLSALFEPLTDVDATANDVKPQTSETAVIPIEPESQSESVAVTAAESVVSTNHIIGYKSPDLGRLDHPVDCSDSEDPRTSSYEIFEGETDMH